MAMHSRVQRIFQSFYYSIALQMFDVIRNECTTVYYNYIVTGKENASKDWNCVILMYLTSFTISINCVWLCLFYMYRPMF